VEIFMDDFTTFGNQFDEALSRLEKVLQRCVENHLSLSNEKCFLMMTEGIVLGHHISAKGIQVDPAKIVVIKNLSVPTKQHDVRSFLRTCWVL
jgi:hypothetical protein